MRQLDLAVHSRILAWAVEAAREKCSNMQVENRQSMKTSVVAAAAVQKNAEVTQLLM